MKLPAGVRGPSAHTPTACWAAPSGGRLTAPYSCPAPPTTDVGLCAAHYREIVDINYQEDDSEVA